MAQARSTRLLLIIIAASSGLGGVWILFAAAANRPLGDEAHPVSFVVGALLILLSASLLLSLTLKPRIRLMRESLRRDETLRRKYDEMS